MTEFVFVRHKIEPQTPRGSAYQADADVGYALRTLITYAPKPSLPWPSSPALKARQAITYIRINKEIVSAKTGGSSD